MKISKSTLMLLFISVCCSSDPDKVNTNKSVTITYQESTLDFPNPERGFYHYSETSASNYDALSESVLKGYRTAKTSSGANYSVISTLVFRYYILDTFRDGPLSDDFLTSVKADFTTARAAGVKLIPRFTYTVDVTAGDCPEQFICPPYGDASKEIVLAQIEQLKPIWQENADVIACLQMGFIGTWGENYYTDYFGDASSNDQGKLLDNNWQDRIDVLKAILDAAPKDIMVQVRYPQIKQRYVYGINAPVTSAPLTADEAFNETDKARIGYHNDCFLASSDDYGTFEDYGNSSTPRTSANTTLRNYFAQDSKYLPVGGETCSDDYSPQNDCDPAGKAEKEMATLHYSFLNTDYNNDVNNDWQTSGCMDNIKKKLGYRFVLRSGVFPTEVKTSDLLNIHLEIENVGYSSPFKERKPILILRNASTAEEFTIKLSNDARTWFSGVTILEASLDVSKIPAGNYALFIQLPDKYSSLANRSEYCIRLANENVWEETTGYNSLQHTIKLL